MYTLIDNRVGLLDFFLHVDTVLHFTERPFYMWIPFYILQRDRCTCGYRFTFYRETVSHVDTVLHFTERPFHLNEVFFDSGFSANSKINSDGFAEKMEYTLTVGGQEMDLKLLHQKTLDVPRSFVENYDGSVRPSNLFINTVSISLVVL